MWKTEMLIVFMLTVSNVILAKCEEPMSENSQSKRILLNDPDVIGKRLTNMDMLLQDLHLKYSQQQGVITSLRNELANGKLIQDKLQLQYSQQEVEITSLRKGLADEKLKHEQSLISQGSTYIRWGRNDCSAKNTDMIYKGYATGEKFTYSSSYKGGDSTMLCLPDNPEVSNKTASGRSRIYGTEFDTNEIITGSYNEDVSCVLCRSRNTSSSVMFPGRQTCYPGWKKEYNGVLAASAYTHNPSPYICVDAHPAYVYGGQRDNEKHLLYISVLKCGSIQCPPYTDNVQVNCIVCSK